MLSRIFACRSHVPFIANSAVRFRFFSAETAKNFIDKVVKENDVVIFMKGTPEKPLCGFSRAACQVFDLQGVRRITAVNVLEDEDIRAGIKSYTSWPTVPQVFIKGNFIGGTDIIIEMHKNGELESLLAKEGLINPSSQDDSTTSSNN